VAATLYAVPASHPCAAAEKALQLKRVEYTRVDIPPVAHKLVLYALFGGGTVPGLVLDGEKILGSRKIVRALERRTPEPPLLPADEKERKSVELAEEWGDEVLQPLVRRVIWIALRRSPASLPSYGEDAGLPIPDALSKLSAPLVAMAEQRINDASELNVRADLRALDHHLARVERWMDHGVVGGSSPNAADLQIGSGLALLLTIQDIDRAYGARRACELARKWFRGYPGHVPRGVLPAEWLHERTSTAAG
jgi:glutathione S-transferase